MAELMLRCPMTDRNFLTGIDIDERAFGRCRTPLAPCTAGDNTGGGLTTRGCSQNIGSRESLLPPFQHDRLLQIAVTK